MIGAAPDRCLDGPLLGIVGSKRVLDEDQRSMASYGIQRGLAELIFGKMVKLDQAGMSFAPKHDRAAEWRDLPEKRGARP